MKRLARLTAGLLACACAAAVAHPLAPALLELRETTPARYEVLWRTTVVRTGTQAVMPRLPEDCRARSEPQARLEGGEAVATRWTVQCESGLAGRAVAVDGLAGSGINVILHLVEGNGTDVKALLDAATPAFVLSGEPVFRSYLALGVAHLLGGLDHLLLLLGLVLLLHGLPALLLATAAFTAGHSITLALAVLGWIPSGAALAEIAIAATLLVLALELAQPAGAPPTLLRRHPGLVAGVFGLIHGLGFASALLGAGLPAAAIPLALLAFNLGIEAGQLGVIAVMLAVAALWRGRALRPAIVSALPAYAIGALAVYWCLERSAGLL